MVHQPFAKALALGVAAQIKLVEFDIPRANLGVGQLAGADMGIGEQFAAGFDQPVGMGGVGQVCCDLWLAIGFALEDGEVGGGIGNGEVFDKGFAKTGDFERRKRCGVCWQGAADG